MVRLARPQDISAIMNVGEIAIKESKHPARMDRKKVRQMLFNTIRLQGKCRTVRVWVLEIEKEICGFMIGQIDSLYFSKSKYATDVVTYVLPKYRGYGILLLKKFKRWAFSDPKVVDITLQLSSGIHIERTGRLYNKLGFHQVGGCYVNYRGAK